MTRALSSRGSVLLVTMVILVVLLILVVGAIGFTGKNREAATGKMRGDQLQACAETARRHLLSQLRLFNVPVRDIQLNTVIPDGDQQMWVATAHYGATTPQPTIVDLSATVVAGAAAQPSDDANVSRSTAVGGQHFGAVVLCRDAAGREAELEFAFRYGF